MMPEKNAGVLSATMLFGAVLVFTFSASQLYGQTTCEWGRWGERCEKACPEHCIANEARKLQHCHKLTGKCSEGCMRGWHGDICDLPCSSHCEKNTCNQQNGLCSFGCDGPYRGDSCNMTTVVVSTHSTSPTPRSSSPRPGKHTDLVVIIVPIIIIIICLVTVAVVAFIVVKREKGRKNGDGRSPEDIPLMERSGAAFGTLGHGLEDQRMEPDPIDREINNTRTLFVETENFKKVREMLETFHHVTISGAPGAGKTSMALMLGDEYRTQGYELVMVEDLSQVNLSDWQGHDVCVIFDDIFQMAGSLMDVPRFKHLLYDLHLCLAQCKDRSERRYESMQQESGEEERRDNQSDMYFIFTTETSALGHAMLKLEGHPICFFSNSTLASLSYTPEEKKEIWMKHKHHYKCKANVDEMELGECDKQTVGFPLVCKLFSSYAAFQEQDETFWEHPVFYLKRELDTMINRRDDHSAALILVLLCDGQLNLNQLETESDNPDLDAHIKAALSFVKTSTRQDVAEAVRSLCGSLLTEGNLITFSHSMIYDVCASVLFGIDPEFIRKHWNIRFLFEHVQNQQGDIAPVNEHQLIIPFSEAYSGTIVDRMADFLASGAFSEYIMHPICRRKDIADRLSQMIKNPTNLSHDAMHNIFHYACVTGNKNIMKRLVPHCDINRRGLNCWTPVMYAVVSGQKKSLKLLVEHNADIKLCDSNNNSLLHLAIENGKTASVEYLLKEHKCDIHTRGMHGWTPLVCAVFAGKKDVLDVLLKHKTDNRLRDTNIRNAIHLACECGINSIVERLLQLTDVNASGKHGQTPIMCSASSGKKNTFDLLLSRKANINLTDDDNNSLLHVACKSDDTSILEYLLTQLDINRPGKHGWTPVMKAAVNGRKDVLDLLVKEKANLELTDDSGNNLLHLACHGGNVSIVKHLLPQFNINSRGGNGWTPVMYAAVNGDSDVFRLLVSRGADLSLEDDYNNSVFHLGCIGGNRTIVKDLLPKADKNSRGNLGRTGIMKSAWAGNADVFKLLVSKKVDLKTVDDNNDTILHHASQGGNCSIVEYLIEKQFDINCRGKNDLTTVMSAAWSGKKDAFELLSSKQDSMSAYNVYRDTILHLACEGGTISIVQSLLLRMDVNIRGKNGRTPVMAAAVAGKKDVFDFLISKKADLTLTDDNKNNILHLACRGGNTFIIEHLIPLFDMNSHGEDGLTPLIMGALSGKKEAYDLIARNGGNQSLTASENDDVLHAACLGGNLAIVKEVIGIFDINTRGRKGETPLMRAVCGGHIAVYRYLMSRGADRTLVDNDGHTLLHFACHHGQLEMVKHIIADFDVNSKDNMGLTPVMTAVLHRQAAVVKYLTNRGTDLTLVDNTGGDALTLALKLGNRQIIKRLDRKQVKQVAPWNELMKSLVRGEVVFLKSYSRGSPELVQTDQDGDSLLHLACRGGNRQCVEYLFPSYDIDVQGRYGWTPAMVAAVCGHADIFQLLLTQKAGLFLESSTGEDILTLARRGKNKEIITHLDKDN
ncbi:serine/threonine-protein phosphatase 6 regulatory ankyrin repeat subunit B-like isoform X1 [Haliotis rufescens]|uniref:serine/threonine-protein phosphatase 6 regulatory ankyrin repeat subunit B-like isoform X1 n=1 Tax=Haliotis rufescens TaxID=6454 RepID=UPI00201FB3AE|nr:serine/threonine-protein phosphatase 6 regulatory ankyrin repeat subunit B-like isoform X1 [Haliotis rufescens]XP_048250898.1 serine/threonine-protein phosphatase 6 regulatory ankyrin repeat subunit B-like isoform X1 [Haliotis rufescens]